MVELRLQLSPNKTELLNTHLYDILRLHLLQSNVSLSHLLQSNCKSSVGVHGRKFVLFGVPKHNLAQR